jgi:hypothetical protein
VLGPEARSFARSRRGGPLPRIVRVVLGPTRLPVELRGLMFDVTAPSAPPRSPRRSCAAPVSHAGRARPPRGLRHQSTVSISGRSRLGKPIAERARHADPDHPDQALGPPSAGRQLLRVRRCVHGAARVKGQVPKECRQTRGHGRHARRGILPQRSSGHATAKSSTNGTGLSLSNVWRSWGGGA